MPKAQTEKGLACIPCAKRKVRCDRSEPCNHCKRRKKESCVYPSRQSNTRESSEDGQNDRIQKLEQYIKNLGGDPTLADQTIAPNPNAQGNSTGQSSSETASYVSNGASTLTKDESAPRKNKTPRESTHPSLIEHDRESVYIEAPVWYSWSDASRPDKDRPPEERETEIMSSPTRCMTLLDSLQVVGDDSIYKSHPSTEEIWFLWRKFLKNVHPLVKIFFAWEKEYLIRKTVNSPQELSRGEHALMFTIYFISILSLSEEECSNSMGTLKSQLLDQLQSTAETALKRAGFISTTEIIVLQALVLYLLAMRNTGSPASLFSLSGVAVRVAERMGLGRDGTALGLSPLETEQRRRIWWQMQYNEIAISQLLGYITLTLYADWDTHMPSNLEDEDIQADMETIPPEREGLTSMSHCLCRYYVLYLQRSSRLPDGRREGFLWLYASGMTWADKQAKMDYYGRQLGEKFLQHCDPLDPLHLHIQITVRGFRLATERLLRQPRMAHAKISDMTWPERDDLLKICLKCLEYFIFSATNDLIKHFAWHNENYFQWCAYVFVVIECHYRYNQDDVADIWEVIERTCKAFPRLTKDIHRREVEGIGRLVLVAWHHREEHLRRLHDQHPETHSLPQQPWFITELQRNLPLRSQPNRGSKTATNNLPTISMDPHDITDSDNLDLINGQGFQDPVVGSIPFFGIEDLSFLDFSSIDWSFSNQLSDQ